MAELHHDDRFSDARVAEHYRNIAAKPLAKFGRGETKEPSAADLDAVADEEKARAATVKPKRVIVAKG